MKIDFHKGAKQVDKAIGIAAEIGKKGS